MRRGGSSVFKVAVEPTEDVRERAYRPSGRRAGRQCGRGDAAYANRFCKQGIREHRSAAFGRRHELGDHAISIGHEHTLAASLTYSLSLFLRI